MKTKIINRKDLDASCWLIQVWGKEYCRKCELRRTKRCGANFGNAKLIKEGKIQPKSKAL